MMNFSPGLQRITARQKGKQLLQEGTRGFRERRGEGESEREIKDRKQGKVRGGEETAIKIDNRHEVGVYSSLC
jgi:hypothetical protein